MPLCARLILSEPRQKKIFFEKKTIIPKILHNTHMRSHKKFCAKKMSFRGVFGLFYQKYPKGGPLENFEKNKKKFFFTIPPKIRQNTHMRSHKKFRAKKMIFTGFLEGGSQREKKSNLAFGETRCWRQACHRPDSAHSHIMSPSD